MSGKMSEQRKARQDSHKKETWENTDRIKGMVA
jgi:hypothetical protein